MSARATRVGPAADGGAAGNSDPAELAKFEKLAHRWWDPEGESRALHEMNPLRLAFVREHAGLAGARALDVGCGGGLFSEALASAGAEVTAIDLSDGVLGVARLHLYESGLTVDYRKSSAEELAASEPGRYDVVACLEMLEHVPDPGAVIQACATLLRPGGKLFLSTLNRTPQAFLGAIVGAEYLLNLLPRGTHEYARFIRPSEMAGWLRAAGLVLRDLRGIRYDPFRRKAAFDPRPTINYLVYAERPQ
jgi:2-polyprenyl-6-hydroxyphenyl methylase/3-demethylubiquinone-9 3-methyltransferase